MGMGMGMGTATALSLDRCGTGPRCFSAAFFWPKSLVERRKTSEKQAHKAWEMAA